MPHSSLQARTGEGFRRSELPRHWRRGRPLQDIAGVMAAACTCRLSGKSPDQAADRFGWLDIRWCRLPRQAS